MEHIEKMMNVQQKLKSLKKELVKQEYEMIHVRTFALKNDAKKRMAYSVMEMRK